MLTKEQIISDSPKYTKDIKSKEDIVLIHITDYFPKDGIIRTPKTLGLKYNETIDLENKKYSYQYNRERDSIHFACNGEVGNHSGGNWDNKKYAIIVPLSKCDIKDFYGGSAVDFFTNGDFKLPEGSYILCPQVELEELRDNVGNKITLYGYEGDSVRGYSNFLIEKLGYQREIISGYRWEDSIYGTIGSENEKFRKILKENRINGMCSFYLA